MKRRIAIVGGGPAGSSLALALVAEGIDPHDVVVLDKARFPRPKLCGGAITFRGTESLRALGGEPAGGARTAALRFQSALGGFDVREPGEQWLYDRAHLDDLLLGRCRDMGVEVRDGVAVTGLEPGPDGFRVRTGRTAEGYDWVAGADGACGMTRRAADLEGGPTGRLVEAVFEPTGEPPSQGRLVFDFDPVIDGIPGYAWIFPYPKPDERGLYKLGVMDGRGRIPGAELRRWTLAFAARHGFRLLDDKVAGWPERYFTARARAHRPGLVLTGEAWGIDPLLGEGIAPSLAMARYAARRIRRALDRGTPIIRGYESGFLLTREGRNLWFQERLANRLYGRHPFRWLRVLFELRTLHRLAASGREAYGRLARRTAHLVGAFALSVLKDGLPAATPITPR